MAALVWASHDSCSYSLVKTLANFNSITVRIMLFGFVILVLSALGRIYFLSDYLRNDLTELTTTQLSSLANYAARDVDHDISERRYQLERISAKFSSALLSDPVRMRDWLRDRHEVSPLFSLGMTIFDLSGRAVADYPVLPGRVGMSYADREYFQRALQGESALGHPMVDRAAKVPVLPMAVPLRDGSGKVCAVLMGATALHAADFLQSLRMTQVGHTGGLLLISPQDRLFVGASDAGLIFKPTPAEGIDLLHDRAMRGFRGVGATVNAFGVEELVGIASVPSTGWFVVARLPSEEAYAPLSRLRRFIINNTGMILLLFVIIIVIGLRLLLKPLRSAAAHADRMTLGEIALEPLPVVRDDEVGHLTVAFNRLLSKLLESRAELNYMAHHDTLTGLPNRQLLADRMKQALARAKRGKGHVAVLFLDLDGFKPINDQFGHDAGDVALRQVTERLQEAVRQEDTLARVGGDEFVIVLSDLHDKADAVAEMVARKCLDVFAQPFLINGQACQMGTSIGIVVGDHRCDPDKLLIAADQAMYRAKEAGRGKYEWAQCSENVTQ